MTRALLVALVLLPVVTFAQSGALPLPGQGLQDQPGRPTQARFFIINKDPRTEAIPVVVAQGAEALRVTLAGTPTVSIEGTLMADTRGMRQPWEYQQIALREGDDAAAALNSAGAQGWELVSTLTRPNGVTFVLKRPK
jgi:hypothetical protein